MFYERKILVWVILNVAWMHQKYSAFLILMGFSPQQPPKFHQNSLNKTPLSTVLHWFDVSSWRLGKTWFGVMFLSFSSAKEGSGFGYKLHESTNPRMNPWLLGTRKDFVWFQQSMFGMYGTEESKQSCQNNVMQSCQHWSTISKGGFQHLAQSTPQRTETAVRSKGSLTQHQQGCHNTRNLRGWRWYKQIPLQFYNTINQVNAFKHNLLFNKNKPKQKANHFPTLLAFWFLEVYVISLTW